MLGSTLGIVGLVASVIPWGVIGLMEWLQPD